MSTAHGLRAAAFGAIVLVAVTACSGSAHHSATSASAAAASRTPAVQTGSGTAVPTTPKLRDEHGAIAAATKLQCTRSGGNWSASTTLVNAGATPLKYNVQFNVVDIHSTVLARAQQVVTVAAKGQRIVAFANFYADQAKSTATSCVPHVTSGTA